MKRKIYIILLFIMPIIPHRASSQTYTLLGDKAFGTNRFEYWPTIFKVDNSAFVLSGISNGSINGDKTSMNCDTFTTSTSDIWMLKIDTGFNVLWDKSFGGNSVEYQGMPMIKKNNGQLIVTCESNSDSSCNKLFNHKGTTNNPDYWIFNIDSNGNQTNQYLYGGTGNDYEPQTIILSSGNYITCGISLSPIGADKTVACIDTTGNYLEDYWVIKTDSMGIKLWDKVYGGSGIEWCSKQSSVFRYGFCVLSDTNDEFLIAGTTGSPASGTISDSSRGGPQDIWVVKIDSIGNKVWDNRFGGSSADICNHIIHTDDGGYILCGSTGSPQGGDVTDSTKGLYDFWVIKLDSLGDKQWDKRYGGNKNDYANWIEKAPGGGYWVAGNSGSDVSGDVTEPRYASNGNDYWIFKIDEYGTKLWDKRFGGPIYSDASSFIIMQDSSIFLAGWSRAGISAVKTDSGRGNSDYWVVHFKYTDSLNLAGINETENQSNTFIISPNPATNTIQITFDKPLNQNTQLQVFDLTGRMVYSKQINRKERKVMVDVSMFGQGTYFVKVNAMVRKIVKM